MRSYLFYLHVLLKKNKDIYGSWQGSVGALVLANSDQQLCTELIESATDCLDNEQESSQEISEVS